MDRLTSPANDAVSPRSAACILAEEAPAPALAAVVSMLADAGLAPIVAVVARGATVPAPARAVVAESRRRDESTALRFGLTQLANAHVRGAVVLRAGAPPALETLLALLDAARRTAAPVVLPVGGAPSELAWVHRDLWRELLVTPGGLAALLDRGGVEVLRVGPRARPTA